METSNASSIAEIKVKEPEQLGKGAESMEVPWREGPLECAG